jgi:uncharacterized coiled-coil protein SlyX
MKGKIRFMKNRNTITICTTILLACFGFLPGAQPVVPAPDGGYPGGNTAEGQNALLSLANGVHNTAIGYLSLRNTTTGSYNTALGSGTLLANTADGNTATGVFALISNTIGGLNTANGALALFSNTEGGNNTANGFKALNVNTTGGSNTANGVGALFNNSTGSRNTALGAFAGQGISTAHNVIAIGTAGANVSNSCFIGHIHGETIDPATALIVAVDAAGKLGTSTSSRRFKHDIKPMDKSSEAILALKPVTFHYTSDTRGTPQFGLIAEEVAEINPDLVVRDKNGDIYTVRYDAVNAMLLNEFLKEHRKNEEQKATIAQLKSTVEKQEATNAQQQKQIEALTAGLQKVSAQVEMGRPAPRVVVKNQ